MFEFEKLEVYEKAKKYSHDAYRLILQNSKIDKTTEVQLRRAAMSIVLNIAEGTGRMHKFDRRRFFVFSRGSVFETIALLEFLKEENILESSEFESMYLKGEEISKILWKMIKNLS